MIVNVLLKYLSCLVGFEKGNGETSFYSYSGELKLVVMGIEKCGWSGETVRK